MDKLDNPVAVGVIQDEVAVVFGLSRADMVSRKRKPELVNARQIAMWVARELTTLSLPAIGREFGGFHHTTVMHAVDQVDARRAADQKLQVLLNSLKERAAAVSRSDLSARTAALDPASAAERVTVGGVRAALRLSALDIVAICVRATDLEELAAGTFQLLADVDRLQAARTTVDPPPLIDRIKSLIETIAGSLEALGYDQEPENEEAEDREAQGAGVPAAAAAE